METMPAGWTELACSDQTSISTEAEGGSTDTALLVFLWLAFQPAMALV